jgi:transcriptional regulator with XRE-family HTH domain
LFNILNNISAKSATLEIKAAKTVQRKVREAQGGLTHRAFAKRLGISVGSLARLRNSPQNVTLYTLAKISRALGITPSQLLDDADAQHRRR